MKKKQKSKIKSDYLLPQLYKEYKQIYTNTSILTDVEFRKVIKSFNKKFVQRLYEGTYFRLPYKLGDFYIRKYKPKVKIDSNGQIVMNDRKSIDYKATNELWKKHPKLAHKQRVYYDNFHTDGYKFKFNWKRYHLGELFKIYNFHAAKYTRLNLAKYLRINPNQDYYDN